MFDLLIKAANIHDGRGKPPYAGDLAVKGDRIVALGDLGRAEARRVIDAAGAALAPGFVDVHSHADLNLLVEPDAAPKVRQGVTTEIVGQCGLGPAPIHPARAAAWRSELVGILGDRPAEWPWTTFAAYLGDLEKARPALNVAALVTHGPLRASTVGLEDRPSDPDSLRTMERTVDEALDDGAFGLSTGLVYLPCLFADADELVALYQRVAAKGAVMVIHIRNQADQALEALDEALEIAARAGVSLHVSHVCVAGRRNVGKPVRMLAALDAARVRGQHVFFDQHPYEAGSTMLTQVLPRWVVEGGAAALVQRLRDHDTRRRIREEIATDAVADPRRPWQNYVKMIGWSSILITSVESEDNRGWVGMSVAEIADRKGRDPFDVAFDLLAEERGMVAMVTLGVYAEEDLRAVMRHDLQMVGSDDIYIGNPHPRLYGSFARVLGKFARDERVLTLPEAIKKMTLIPARRFGLADRGELREGAYADLVLFDPERVRDTATYAEPRQYAEGISHVVVNGQVVVADGRQTDTRPGRVLRRGQG